jgi:hypothetical protein
MLFKNINKAQVSISRSPAAYLRQNRALNIDFIDYKIVLRATSSHQLREYHIQNIAKYSEPDMLEF